MNTPHNPALIRGVSTQAFTLQRWNHASGIWVLIFIAFQFACQVMLLLPAVSQARVVFRMAAFLASATLVLAFSGRRGSNSGAQSWGYGVLVIIALNLVNLSATTMLGAFAQAGMYFCILGPVFWTSKLRITPLRFQHLIYLLWAFYSASAALGVLQAYFPGSFQPPLSMLYADKGADVLRSLQIELASGERVFRPMGLTDIPGGAAYGGLYAVVFGMGALQSTRTFAGMRVLALSSIILGAMCLYLCQVRALLVMAGICVLTMIAMHALSGRFSRLVAGLVALGTVIPVSFALALSVGGESVTRRLSTLTADSMGSVYYRNRGHFLEHTITELVPQYPFGAGLGRWGMMNRYFGDGTNFIWAEIQWTGWVLDGGLPLVFAYVGAIFYVSWRAFRLAVQPASLSGGLSELGGLILAYNIGAFALCFSYPVFIGTAGIEFWVLNAALLQAAAYARHDPETVHTT